MLFVRDNGNPNNISYCLRLKVPFMFHYCLWREFIHNNMYICLQSEIQNDMHVQICVTQSAKSTNLSVLMQLTILR